VLVKSKSDRLGTGLNNAKNQKEFIQARNQAKTEKDIIATQDDLLDFLDTRAEADKQPPIVFKKDVSPFVTPVKKEPSAVKQSNLFNFMKKRDEKLTAKEKVLSQSG
jgi:hypothetical protein